MSKLWKRANPVQKAVSVGGALLCSLLLLKLLIRDHDNLFVLAELSHFAGIGFLLFKLLRAESCEGFFPRLPALRQLIRLQASR